MGNWISKDKIFPYPEAESQEIRQALDCCIGQVKRQHKSCRSANFQISGDGGIYSGLGRLLLYGGIGESIKTGLENLLVRRS